MFCINYNCLLCKYKIFHMQIFYIPHTLNSSLKYMKFILYPMGMRQSAAAAQESAILSEVAEREAAP